MSSALSLDTHLTAEDREATGLSQKTQNAKKDDKDKEQWVASVVVTPESGYNSCLHCSCGPPRRTGDDSCPLSSLLSPDLRLASCNTRPGQLPAIPYLLCVLAFIHFTVGNFPDLIKSRAPEII